MFQFVLGIVVGWLTIGPLVFLALALAKAGDDG